MVRLSRTLGHTQITTTMRYVQMLTGDLQVAHGRCSPLARLRVWIFGLVCAVSLPPRSKFPGDFAHRVGVRTNGEVGVGCTTYADGETREPAHFSTAIGRHDRLVTVNDIQTYISQQLDAALPMMPDHLRAWVESHRIVPREITVFSDPDGSSR